MAEASDVPMEEVAAANTSEANTPMEATSVKETANTEATVEPSVQNGEEGAKTDDQGKGRYTEEERLKRKAFFKQIRDKRRIAREKYRQNYIKKFGDRQRFNSHDGESPQKDIIISFNMTEEDKKMLDFYKVRMSTLKIENEQLHKRLAYLVKENMRFLQMGPSMTPAAFKA
uniref:Uncharacterized protein n=1 Tax=Cuerna arida TaxID=1464854 RepID=A0A1B6EPH3_9HEMI